MSMRPEPHNAFRLKALDKPFGAFIGSATSQTVQRYDCLKHAMVLHLEQEHAVEKSE